MIASCVTSGNMVESRPLQPNCGGFFWVLLSGGLPQCDLTGNKNMSLDLCVGYSTD